MATTTRTPHVQRVSARRKRAQRANALITRISELGRQFFDHTRGWDGRPRGEGAVSRFEVNESGRVCFVDGYRGSRIATLHPNSRWRGFSQGGTLRQLVEQLSQFVMWGTDPGLILSWPSWCSEGDPWGYGDDMDAVRRAARTLGLYPQQPA